MDRSILRGAFVLCALLVLTWFCAAPGRAEPAGRCIVFHAGSLTVPFAAMEKDFERQYPRVDVLREAGGSTKMARMISELNKPADIMASADFEVIDKTLIPERPDGTSASPPISSSCVTRKRVVSLRRSMETTGLRSWAGKG